MSRMTSVSELTKMVSFVAKVQGVHDVFEVAFYTSLLAKTVLAKATETKYTLGAAIADCCGACELTVLVCTPPFAAAVCTCLRCRTQWRARSETHVQNCALPHLCRLADHFRRAFAQVSMTGACVRRCACSLCSGC